MDALPSRNKDVPGTRYVQLLLHTQSVLLLGVKASFLRTVNSVPNISNAASHVIAGAIRSGLEVQSVDGVNICIIFTVELLSIIIVGPHLPQLMHLSHYHRRDIIKTIIVIIILSLIHI